MIPDCYRGDRRFAPGYEPLHWAAAARGAVLEVGLGLGVLAREIHRRVYPGCHHIVEMDAELAANIERPARSTVIVGTFPDVVLPRRRYDVIYLDIPGACSPPVVARAVELLADGGIIGLRK